jgi:hypothetical protein
MTDMIVAALVLRIKGSSLKSEKSIFRDCTEIKLS